MKYNLISINPFQLLDREFDRLFELNGSGQPAIPVDLVQTGEKIIIEAQIPGVKKEDIELSFEDGWLTVSGMIAAPEYTENSRVHLQEIPRGRFSKRIHVGREVDAEGAEATANNGILTISLKIAEQAKPRRISIN